MPPLFAGFIDDAALIPLGDTPPAEAVAEHRHHRSAWYAPLVGPLLIPAELAFGLWPAADPTRPDVAIVIELARVEQALDAAPVRVEVAVAKRGEDPEPGLTRLLEFATGHPEVEVLAEVPLTWGLSKALDTMATARRRGRRIAPKFRVGGLAAELFPTPVELAAIICACRDRDLPFALGAGLRRAIRHSDAETGFTHHGFLNVLAATVAAAEGAEVAPVAERLAATDAVPLIDAIRAYRAKPRPLWTAFAVRQVRAVVADLTGLGLLAEPRAPG